MTMTYVKGLKEMAAAAVGDLARHLSDSTEKNLQRVWVTRAMGEGCWRVGIFPPAPVPVTTRTRDPCGLANP